MVWSQYVYEATVDLDSYASGDEDDGHEITPLNIEDWEVEYSDELKHMWSKIITLLYDAHIEHTGQFCDFVEFCYIEHDTDSPRITWESQEQTLWYEDRLAYIWRNLRHSINENGLHEEMMRGATFNDFTDFVKNYMCVY
tara:strand:+ start:840 stop:1259 length:420 start_codon:yes stop_codon:yes gene_type:complete